MYIYIYTYIYTATLGVLRKGTAHLRVCVVGHMKRAMASSGDFRQCCQHMLQGIAASSALRSSWSRLKELRDGCSRRATVPAVVLLDWLRSPTDPRLRELEQRLGDEALKTWRKNAPRRWRGFWLPEIVHSHERSSLTQEWCQQAGDGIRKRIHGVF